MRKIHIFHQVSTYICVKTVEIEKATIVCKFFYCHVLGMLVLVCNHCYRRFKANHLDQILKHGVLYNKPLVNHVVENISYEN